MFTSFLICVKCVKMTLCETEGVVGKKIIIINRISQARPISPMLKKIGLDSLIKGKILRKVTFEVLIVRKGTSETWLSKYGTYTYI